MKKVIAFLIILIAFGLFTVSFGTFWYKYERKSIEEDNESKTINYYSFNKVRNLVISSDGDTYRDETGKYSSDGREHEIQIFEASIAFSILAWVCLLICLFLYLLSFVGIIDKIPIIGQIGAIIGKYILIPGVIFGLLSVFIFVGLGNAKNKDCNCDNYKFLTTLTSDYEMAKYYIGPTTGWIVVLIGTFFTIIGAIINIFSKTFNL